ncbi:uncharacterized protein LOC126982438 isoform X2 [Eriocheir sinensis]|uniref:uncharacterized protein LOC126982438 isoform X2 n=1 Tax=Eriocheir sinensis TaxID=95602 RepID=UPI0021C60CE3|nr:uncharacterized protein LOC126982438 isoform X2 [Eriocheir sinensis]
MVAFLPPPLLFSASFLALQLLPVLGCFWTCPPPRTPSPALPSRIRKTAQTFHPRRPYPGPWPGKPTPYPGTPTPYPATPTPYPGTPTPYPSTPTPYPGTPSLTLPPQALIKLSMEEDEKAEHVPSTSKIPAVTAPTKTPKSDSNTPSTTTPHLAWGFVGVVGLVVVGVKCRRRQKTADPRSPTPQVPPRPSPEDGYVEPNPVLPRHAPDGHQGSTRHPMLSRARSRTSSTNIYDEIPLPGRNQTRLLRQDSNGYVMMLPTPLQPHRESAESEGDSRKSFRPPPWYEARQPPTSSPAQQTTRSGTPNLLEL